MAYTILKIFAVQIPSPNPILAFKTLEIPVKHIATLALSSERCIAEENCLYITPRLPAAESWRRVFFRMWKHKNMWKPKVLSQEQQSELDCIHLAGLEDAARCVW